MKILDLIVKKLLTMEKHDISTAPKLVRQGYHDKNGNVYFHYYCVCGVGMGTPNLCGDCKKKELLKDLVVDDFDKSTSLKEK